MTTVARPLSVGIIIRLVSLRSSLRALDSAGERLVLGNLAVLRIPTTWVWALFVIPCEALASKGCLGAGNYLCCGVLLG